MNFKNSYYKIIFFTIIAALLIFAFVSVTYAFNIANTYGSTDFQYSGAVIFKEKINPYEYFLYLANNDNLDKIIGVQYPVYSHALYPFFYFFTFFDWYSARLIWSIINIFLGLTCVVIISKYFQFTIMEIIFLTCFFLISTPFRNVIANGQQTFLILICFCSYFIKKPSSRNFFLGISFIKYSFMPLTVMTIFLREGLKMFFISGTFCLTGWIIFSLYLDQSLIHTLFQPITAALSSGSVYSEAGLARGDLYTILGYFKKLNPNFNPNYLIIFTVLSVCFFLAKNISKQKEPILIMSLLLVGNLLIFPHLMYDYVILLPAFLYSYKNIRFLNAKLSMIIIFYFWYGIRLFDYLKMYIYEVSIIIPNPTNVSYNFILLIFLYILNLNIKSNIILKFKFN